MPPNSSNRRSTAACACALSDEGVFCVSCDKRLGGVTWGPRSNQWSAHERGKTHGASVENASSTHYADGKRGREGSPSADSAAKVPREFEELHRAASVAARELAQKQAIERKALGGAACAVAVMEHDLEQKGIAKAAEVSATALAGSVAQHTQHVTLRLATFRGGIASQVDGCAGQQRSDF